MMGEVGRGVDSSEKVRFWRSSCIEGHHVGPGFFLHLLLFCFFFSFHLESAVMKCVTDWENNKQFKKWAVGCLSWVDMQTIICKKRITEKPFSFQANKGIIFCRGAFIRVQFCDRDLGETKGFLYY